MSDGRPAAAPSRLGVATARLGRAPLRVDVGFALALAALGVAEVLAWPGSRLPIPAVILFCLPVAAWRRRPAVAAGAAAALVLVAPDGDPPLVVELVAAVLAYGCGAHASVRSGALGLAALLVALEVAIGIPEDQPIPYLLLTLPAFWVGRQVVGQRRTVQAIAERTRELEAEEDAFARLAVRRERARIARELHDIVAHHLAVIVVQAGAGRLGRSDRAAQRFASIRQSGREALAEMDRLVDLLDTGDDAAERGRLRVLLESAGASGLAIRVSLLPVAVRLPAAVEEGAYRVVQESLTNAIKHAPGATVHVRLAVLGEELEIEVRDEGAAGASPLAATGAGLGLTGMRERVGLLGGRLEAGPADGGWRVCARLPLGVAEVAPHEDRAAREYLPGGCQVHHPGRRHEPARPVDSSSVDRFHEEVVMSHLTQPAVPLTARRTTRRDTATGGVLGLLALAALVFGLTLGDRPRSAAESARALSKGSVPMPRAMSRPAPARPSESAVAAAVGTRPAPARPDESAVAAAIGPR